MFSYFENDSVLHRRNPIIKLLVIVVMTVLVCFSYFPVLPIVTFLLAFISTLILGRISVLSLLKYLVVFITISFIFMISMLVLRGLNDEVNIVLSLGVLRWSSANLIHSITLGFRMLALVTMSMSFVITTKPRDLVLSLIIQCRLSPEKGYATMATYRFLPELQSHVEAIHLAQEIRGIPWNKGIISRLTSPFRVFLPLVCIAARRGERVACAMESRGIGRDNPRTYYRKTSINKGDWIFLITSIGVYVLICVLLQLNGLFHFSVASIQ